MELTIAKIALFAMGGFILLVSVWMWGYLIGRRDLEEEKFLDYQKRMKGGSER